MVGIGESEAGYWWLALTFSQNWNGVASCRCPWMAPAFPAIDSRSMPIVILDGKPCGLKRMSGT